MFQDRSSGTFELSVMLAALSRLTSKTPDSHRMGRRIVRIDEEGTKRGS